MIVRYLPDLRKIKKFFWKMLKIVEKTLYKF